MKVVLATIQRGRMDHLTRQRAALARSSVRPDAHVVVSMDPDAPRLDGCDVVHLPVDDGDPLPLSAARNAAIARAEDEHGAELVVMLDVDCLPAELLISRYRQAAAQWPRCLFSGAVHYLQPGAPASGPLPDDAELAAAPPHPARPVAADTTLLLEGRTELFWSLSFAIAPKLHAQVGGFDEAYVGYGGEDTDYGMRIRRAQLPFAWVGGATAYHQHHPVSIPPVEHLADIVRNARMFHARWGSWPMGGWLGRFREQGLVEWDDDERTLTLTTAGQAMADGSSRESNAPPGLSRRCA